MRLNRIKYPGVNLKGLKTTTKLIQSIEYRDTFSVHEKECCTQVREFGRHQMNILLLKTVDELHKRFG